MNHVDIEAVVETHQTNQYYADRVEAAVKRGERPNLLDMLNMGTNWRALEKKFEGAFADLPELKK